MQNDAQQPRPGPTSPRPGAPPGDGPPAGGLPGRAVALALVGAIATVLVSGSLWMFSARRADMSRDVATALEEAQAAATLRDAAEVQRRLADDARARAAAPAGLEAAAPEEAARRRDLAAAGHERRRRTVARQAQLLLSRLAPVDAAEAARLRGVEAALALAASSEPPLDEPQVLLQEQDSYRMLPPREHGEFDAAAARMEEAMLRAAAANPESHGARAYLAYVLAARGEAQAAVAAAEAALDLAPTTWLAWQARGQARAALGDLEGAERDLLVADALCAFDPTWPLLARAALAEARDDLAQARDLYTLARDLGKVPEEHGRRAALDERIARLEAAAPPPAGR